MQFPILYHAHHTRHLEDLPFWQNLAVQQGNPLLELGCGTGRVLLPLCEAGFSVFGLDNDPYMLAILHQNRNPELHRSAYFFRADLSNFCLAISFGLIILPCNTLSTLTATVRFSMLERVRQHLRIGGLFAASLPNPALLARLPAHSNSEVEEVFPHPLDGEPVQVSSGWERTATLLNIQWHYDHLQPDGHVRRLSVQSKHNLVSAWSYLDEFRDAGLEVVNTYGDFDHSPYHDDAPYLIITATKTLNGDM
jgi:SAM-dependent methyltransferase